MKRLQELLNQFLLAAAAGACIAIGGVVYLAQSSAFAGAFLFAVGLLTILIFGFSLFTGMVGYLGEQLLQKNWFYTAKLVIVWIGNFAGAALVALLVSMTRLGKTLIPKSVVLADIKISDTWYSLLILGVFCGMLMYIAVDTFKKRIGEKDFLCVIAVFMGVMVFILAGFEHSIADMFYFCLAKKPLEGMAALLFITLGNAIGGNVIPMLKKLTEQK